MLPTRYLLESSDVDGYLLEDSAGVLVLESSGAWLLPSAISAVERGGAVERRLWQWQSNADGDAVSDWFELSATIDRIVTQPSSVAVPSANYDVTLIDEDGADVLFALAANRSATAVEVAYVYQASGTGDIQRSHVAGRVRLTVANAGSHKGGAVAIYSFPE